VSTCAMVGLLSRWSATLKGEAASRAKLLLRSILATCFTGQPELRFKLVPQSVSPDTCLPAFTGDAGVTIPVVQGSVTTDNLIAALPPRAKQAMQSPEAR